MAKTRWFTLTGGKRPAPQTGRGRCCWKCKKPVSLFCDNCNPGTVKQSATLIVSGVANGTHPTDGCTNASSFNGTWVLPWAFTEPRCNWDLVTGNDGFCSGPKNFDIDIQKDVFIPVNMLIRLGIDYNGATTVNNIERWEFDFGTPDPVDCSPIDQVLPTRLSSYDGAYDFSGATFRVIL